MSNRSATLSIAVIAFLLFGCPGLLLLCNGMIALTEIISGYRFHIYGYNAPYFVLGSFCLAVFFLMATLLALYFVLRKR